MVCEWEDCTPPKKTYHLLRLCGPTCNDDEYFDENTLTCTKYQIPR